MITSLSMLIFNISFLHSQDTLDKIDNGSYVYDPLEPLNRSVLKFNMIIDKVAIQPLVTSYKTITPDLVEDGVSNFFINLREPFYAISFLMQGDLKKSITSLARFSTNTLTSLGTYDLASRFDLKKSTTDFGVTLGKSGFGSGPYLILPLLGPSNARDAIGRIGDFYIDPLSSIANDEIINTNNFSYPLIMRSNYDDELKDLKLNSQDLYNSIKLLYHQRRMGSINKDYLKDLPVPNIYIE